MPRSSSPSRLDWSCPSEKVPLQCQPSQYTLLDLISYSTLANQINQTLDLGSGPRTIHPLPRKTKESQEATLGITILLVATAPLLAILGMPPLPRKTEESQQTTLGTTLLPVATVPHLAIFSISPLPCKINES